ncbi:DUF6065 family protein [Novosphingobium sp.]|uniref:DUF6065 family protein n=1 Tax=Novosphingobium sp. TaxID=1874826 RepID=UPI0028A5B83B|nr:DUF6065 family protein [Novosphingobium sp.]
MKLTCYVYSGWKPRIRAASQARGWMDATPERFAYRCLPLDIANSHGWEVLSPVGFEAEWNGGSAPEDVIIRPDPASPREALPVALFGAGVLTFHVEGLFRTEQGINLWAGGPPNSAKDGIAPLSGLIETDWSPYSFTMNWRFTRPNHVIRFEENEPFCFIFPIGRAAIEQVEPEIRPIEDAPELKEQFETWSAGRDAFHARMAAEPPSAPADKWQKNYFRGTYASGAPGPSDHKTKLRLAEFKGAEAFHRGPEPRAGCPHAEAARVNDKPQSKQPQPGKLQWIMESIQRLGALSENRQVPRYDGIDAQAFLDRHYAANWPALLAGELADWPALQRWTPEYLKSVIGAAPVEVQADRSGNADFERNMDKHVTTMPFDTFIDRITSPGSGNDLYLTAYNAGANAEALAPLVADLGFLDKFLTRDCDRPYGMTWIGPLGTFTPLHHDLTNNLLLQLVGSKRILLASPLETPRIYNDFHVYSEIRDLAEPDLTTRFPALKGMRVHQVDLRAGEALFIPLGWWHQVTSTDFSVTITHTNFHWQNDFYQEYPQ